MFKQLYHADEYVLELTEEFVFTEHLTNKIYLGLKQPVKANSYHYVYSATKDGRLLKFDKSVCYSTLIFQFAKVNNNFLHLTCETKDCENLTMYYVINDYNLLEFIKIINKKYNIEYKKSYTAIALAKPIIDYFKYFNYTIKSCVIQDVLYLG